MHQIHKKLVSISIESLRLIAKAPLKKKDYKVLLFLMSHLDSLTYKRVDKKPIAEELGMDKDDVEQSLENLVHAGLLIEGESGMVRKGYKFDF